MSFGDFDYGPAGGGTRSRLAASIFSDSRQMLDQMREDCEGAGLTLLEAGPVALLLGERPLGELVLLDCPRAGPAELAALARLDMRAARSGLHLVVSTVIESLDEVFASLDQSNPQILVDATRAERVIALGRALARAPDLRLRELSQEDRLTLLRLSEQVGQLAAQLEDLGAPQPFPGLIADSAAFRFESPTHAFDNGGASATRSGRLTRPALPDAGLVRRIIRQRQLRAKYFDGDLFADPAWDMLLDLTAARVEQQRVSVTSLCIASRVPATTALRWINQMTQAGLLERIEDDTDRRRAFIQLTAKAAEAMAGFFAEIGRGAAKLT